jgi:opacity protein-like surface antigen
VQIPGNKFSTLGDVPVGSGGATMMKTVVKLAVSAVMMTSAAIPALAADLYEPEVIVYKDPEPAPAYGGWYLRGYIGMTNQRYKGLDYAGFHDAAIQHSWLDKGGFGSSPLFGGAVGYQVNHWLRGDISVEYRGKASFNALDRVVDAGAISTNDYRAMKSEWLLLANAYADLGTYHGITPYIGAGIGASRNTISHFNDTNVQNSGGGYAGTGSKWNLAWALHAGLGYELTERATLDLGYSFVHLGDGKTARAYNHNGTSRPNDGFKFKDLVSHDVKVGLRYKLY